MHDYLGLTLAAANSSNVGGDTRFAFWPASQAPAADVSVCETFSDTGGNDQEGVALHVTVDDGGTVRAVTVTKNIFYGAIWDFNVHIWDSSDTTPPFTLISDADLEPTMFFQAYPWRLCARTLGSTLDWKVWPTYESEPAWGDPNYGGTAQVPDGWQNAGQYGEYGPPDGGRHDYVSGPHGADHHGTAAHD